MTTEHDPIWIARSVAVKGGETVEDGVLKQGNSVVAVIPKQAL